MAVISFIEQLHRLAADRPDRPAVTCGDEMVTYPQLIDRIDDLANELRGLGVGEGDMVTIGWGEFRQCADILARIIDAKSPYTGGHCQRVPALTMMLAEAVPVEPTTLHCGVPPDTEPVTLTIVGSFTRQAVLSAPAFASGASFSATVLVLLALHPPGALTETDKVVVPVLPAVHVTVRVFCPAVMVPLVTVQL